MAGTQHLDEIEIPIIEIAPGWAAEDVKTDDDYDDAYAYLMAAVAEIEFQIEMNTLRGNEADPEWAARARRALKYKRAALSIITVAKGRRNDAAKRAAQGAHDRQFSETAKRVLPTEWFRRVVDAMPQKPIKAEAA